MYRRLVRFCSLIIAFFALIIWTFAPYATDAQRGGHGGHGNGRGGGHSSWSGGRSFNNHSGNRMPSPGPAIRTSPSHPNFGRNNGGWHNIGGNRGIMPSYRGPHYRPGVIIHNRPVYRPIIVTGPHPYFWHPYQPFFGWYDGWYPVGTFLAGIAATAIIVGTIDAVATSNSNTSNLNNSNVYYDNGNFYLKNNNQYRVIQAPVGMVVPNIPSEATQCNVNDIVYYYYAGVFYQQVNDGYQVINAPYGAIVYNLPPGVNETQINGQVYYVLNGVYYQPVTYEDQPAFQVVEQPQDMVN